VIDLSDLGPEEEQHFERSYAAYCAGMPWAEFGRRMVYGTDNPFVRAAGGLVTPDVWRAHLFRAVRDLADRLGIQQETVAPEVGDDPEVDPLADEWLTVSEAAARKGVSHSGLHQAITRGDVIARPARPSGAWLVVSRRSLEHWQPDPLRQTAGRLARRRAATC
jgi:hypothetical protein